MNSNWNKPKSRMTIHYGNKADNSTSAFPMFCEPEPPFKLPLPSNPVAGGGKSKSLSGDPVGYHIWGMPKSGIVPPNKK